MKTVFKYTTPALSHVNTVPQCEKDILLCFVKNISKVELYREKTTALTDKEKKRLETLIKKRKVDIPIAYLTNHKEFYGRSFFVDKNVLIPRPETELIIDEVLVMVDTKEPVTIIDIGTGSGNIAVTLAKELPNAKIIATDIDKKALILAKKNAIIHNVNGQIKFIQSDLLGKVKQNEDVLIANLPYLPENNDTNLLREAGILYEPKLAIFSVIDGLDLYKKLIQELRFKKFKKLFFEIDPSQNFEITRLITNTLKVKKTEIKKDLQGLDRLMIATL